MVINLQKGERKAINLPKFNVGLSWKPNETSTGVEFDLDATVFILNDAGVIESEQDMVFYGNLQSGDGAVVHSGDCNNGNSSQDGDNEIITIDTSLISPTKKEMVIVVSIHDAVLRGQNFGQVRDSVIRIYDPVTGEEELKFELDEDYSIETSMVFGRIYNKNGEWRFEANGTGQREGLAVYVRQYAPNAQITE